jgi:hypothetical protein
MDWRFPAGNSPQLQGVNAEWFLEQENLGNSALTPCNWAPFQASIGQQHIALPRLEVCSILNVL